MEKVGDSQPSSGPFTPTSNEMKEQLPRLLMIEVEYSEICFEKIKGVLEKLKEETPDIDTFYFESLGTVMVSGYFDTGKFKMELENEMGEAIKSITGSNDTTCHPCLPQMRVPEMRVPQPADTRTEILNHSEVTIEYSTKSRQRDRGVVTLKPEKEDAGGSGFPKMKAAEVPGSSTEILNSSEITMERNKNSRWWDQ
ncbi:uncharacterized protein LOC121983936 isoform X1 [Zingiber officinale]|uniref:uncharacterized protein LOC121983936 isoform X1 n=1 Tax=Zingiber officinale TaxID=94328 RepID=UPI001C4BF2F4|nr:uncharacterized protein LOC121983936 isoform X1 [Zingiber officinale]